MSVPFSVTRHQQRPSQFSVFHWLTWSLTLPLPRRMDEPPADWKTSAETLTTSFHDVCQLAAASALIFFGTQTGIGSTTLGNGTTMNSFESAVSSAVLSTDSFHSNNRLTLEQWFPFSVPGGQGAGAGRGDAGDAGGAGRHAQGARGRGAARDRPLQGRVPAPDGRPPGLGPAARTGDAADPPRHPRPLRALLAQVPRIGGPPTKGPAGSHRVETQATFVRLPKRENLAKRVTQHRV